MPTIPSYLQGTATGGLLSSAPAQSYVPAISGTQAQQYTPGYGQAPYAAAPPPGTSGLLSGAISGATGAQTSATGANAAQIAAIQNLLNTKKSWGTGQKEFYQNQLNALGAGSAASGAAPAAGAPADTGITVVGQSPESSIKDLKTRGGPSGSGGGGGGGSSGGGGGGGMQGAPDLSMTEGANMPAANNTPGFTTPQDVATNPVNYVPPTGNTPTYGPTGGNVANGGQGVLQMNAANPQSGMDAYKNTTGYQLMNAPGAYEQSPGYQNAMKEALGQVQNNASARGMLESGSALRDMTKTASNMAMQDYGNWWNRQNQLYGDYQNRLAGLAGGPTGGDQAMQKGALQGQGSMQTGENVASLFGNQGNTGLGAYTATGAAQTNTMNQAANTQLQVNSTNNSALMAGAMMNKGAF